LSYWASSWVSRRSAYLAFILYGHIAGIEPVLVLHLVLLPVNIIRLAEALGVSLPSVLSAAIRRCHPVH